MFLDKSHNLKEESYIAQEILGTNPSEDVRQKCIIINQLVGSGLFSLEKALATYQVTDQQYRQFLSEKAIDSLQKELEQLEKDLSADHRVELRMRLFQFIYQALSSEGKKSSVLHGFFTEVEKDIHSQLANAG